MSVVTIHEIIQRFNLEVVTSNCSFDRHVLTPDLSRPGLELTGFMHYYPKDRIQIFGRTELSYFLSLSSEERIKRMDEIATQETPCFIVTRDMEIPQEMIQIGEAKNVPILRTSQKTTHFISTLTNFLESKLAPMTIVHGVLVDIYGVGILITGASGIGKSEAALELVKRGHRFIADDSVEVRQQDIQFLIGNAPEIIQHLIEIRGIGIINIMTLFGAGAVKKYKRISFVIHVEAWDEKKHYDRLGLDEEFMQVLDSEIPKITIPVRPGRNLAIIIEVAAMNYRLKRLGHDAARAFSDHLDDTLEDGEQEDL